MFKRGIMGYFLFSYRQAQSIKNQIAQAYNRFVRLYKEDIIRHESGHGYNSDRINPKIEQYFFL